MMKRTQVKKSLESQITSFDFQSFPTNISFVCNYDFTNWEGMLD